MLKGPALLSLTGKVTSDFKVRGIEALLDGGVLLGDWVAENLFSYKFPAECASDFNDFELLCAL